MTERQFSGARWWKFDFHTHTPASGDFMQGADERSKADVTPESWLREFMKKGIDCVAITDHNSGAWINLLKGKLRELEQDKPDWYHPLYLFPGVEISAHGGVHILAIFGDDKSTGDIDSLLGAVGYSGTRGASDAVTNKSIDEVVDTIAHQGGIAIPAHVDKEKKDHPKGLFHLLGPTLEKVLDNKNIYSMELRDSDYKKPRLYVDKKLQWTEVRGSDTHFREDNFGTFTWVKMDEPSIEGLKLALMDGTASVNRNMDDDPNRHAEYVIDEISVENAKYMGRSQSLNCQFSPFLNAIIGGRGSGKSTLLEFMRFVLRRERDIPDTLQKESEKYFHVGGDNLLTDSSKISLIYRKGDVRYRLNWSANADMPSLQEKKDDAWEDIPGDINSLFPVHVYSQKQIFELGKEPSALIDIIDKAPEIEYSVIKEKREELIDRYKQIVQKIQELRRKVAQENQLRGEWNDLVRQIDQIEKSRHKDVLQNYRKRRQQLNEIESLGKDWHEMYQRLAEMRDDIAPVSLSEEHFAEHSDILSALKETNERWRDVGRKLGDLVQEASAIVSGWRSEKAAAAWMQTLETEMEKYEQSRTQLEQQGIEPSRYPLLLQRQKDVQGELRKIEESKSDNEKLQSQGKQVFEKIEENRSRLSENREEFLRNVIEGNKYVHIEVKRFGEDWQSVEEDIRRILQCPDHFDKDIEGLKNIYQRNGGQQYSKLKEAVIGIRREERSAIDSRFANHLQKLPLESIIDLYLWFPEDDLEITFGPKNSQIRSGSPGQKTAALLAFILSYGHEPLLLDQPEDDLDNELIYSLIVQQLRDVKSKRQVIVVTHNANVVVNGDAEMVFPLKVAHGETRVQEPASIQKRQVRKEICNILEGGEQALDQRYKRIRLEHSND